MTLYHPRPERWPQFTLRELLIAVTLAALLMPWSVAEYDKWHERWLDYRVAVETFAEFQPVTYGQLRVANGILNKRIRERHERRDNLPAPH